MKEKIVIFALSVILFGNVYSVSADKNSTYSKDGFSIEYPSDWKVKDNWNKFQNEVFFQADLRSNSGVSIKHQKSITSISTINDELIQFMIENERETCRMNKEGPCWEFVFTSAKTTIVDGTKAMLLQYEAILNDKESIIKKIFIPDEDENWLITIKVTKDKSELLDVIGKSVSTFSRNIETVNEIEISNAVNIIPNTENAAIPE